MNLLKALPLSSYFLLHVLPLSFLGFSKCLRLKPIQNVRLSFLLFPFLWRICLLSPGCLCSSRFLLSKPSDTVANSGHNTLLCQCPRGKCSGKCLLISMYFPSFRFWPLKCCLPLFTLTDLWYLQRVVLKTYSDFTLFKFCSVLCTTVEGRWFSMV